MTHKPSSLETIPLGSQRLTFLGPDNLEESSVMSDTLRFIFGVAKVDGRLEAFDSFGELAVSFGGDGIGLFSVGAWGTGDVGSSCGR